MSLPSGLPEEIEDDELIARFLTSSSHVTKSKGRIKHSAFRPAPDNDTSVFRVTGDKVVEVQSVAQQLLGKKAKYGAAILKAKSVTEDAKLLLLAYEPPLKHANIRGWSIDDDPEKKSAERNSKAMILAAEAQWMEWGENNLET